MRIDSLHTSFAKWMAGWVFAALSGCATLPNSAKIEHDGSIVAMAYAPGNPPVVVFQSGLGDGMSVWSEVLQRLPSDVGSFAYDRPGYGGSASKRGQRDPCTIARELRELLRSADVRPPYVLVGHSLGGIYQYAFATLFPNEVSGLLLVDATHPDQWETMRRTTPNTAAVVQGLRFVAFSDIERREFDAQSLCLSSLLAVSASSISAKLLSRGRPELTESAEFIKMSRDLAGRWSEFLPGITMSQVEGAGHYIQKEKPELVAAEIGELVTSARDFAR